MLINLKFVFIGLTTLTLSCKCCLRTPTVESGPTITIAPMITTTTVPCPANVCTTTMIMFTTPGPVLSAPTADANCVYTIIASCTAGFSLIQLSGSGNGVFGPPPMRTITCDATTGMYTFIDNAPSVQVVTSVGCIV